MNTRFAKSFSSAAQADSRLLRRDATVGKPSFGHQTAPASCSLGGGMLCRQLRQLGDGGWPGMGEKEGQGGGWISPSHPSHYDISSLGFTQCMYSRTVSYSALHITHVAAQANSVGVMPCRCLNVSSGAAMIITQLAHYRNIYHQQFTITASIIPMSKLATWPREVQPWNSLIIESITLCRNPSQQSSQLSHPPYLTDY